MKMYRPVVVLVLVAKLHESVVGAAHRELAVTKTNVSGSSTNHW